MSENKEVKVETTVTNEGMQQEVVDGQVIYTKPAKERKPRFEKVKNWGRRKWEWVKANPLKALGFVALTGGAIYAGKELYDKGRADGYADGMTAQINSLETPETPALEEPAEDPELKVPEEMEETEEVVG